MTDPSPLLAGREPASVLSVFGEGSEGRKTQRGVESESSLDCGRSQLKSVDESLVKGLEGEGHPLESGCPAGKWEEVGHENLDRCLAAAS